MAYPPHIRAKVRGLWVNGGMRDDRIAVETGVPEATIRSWRRKDKDAGDDWERARNAARIAQGGMGEVTQQVMQDFVLFAEDIIPDIKGSDLSPDKKVELIASFSDSWAKFIKVMGRASPEVAKLAVAMECLKELVEHLRERHPVLLRNPELIQALDEFGPILSAKFGASKVGTA